MNKISLFRVLAAWGVLFSGSMMAAPKAVLPLVVYSDGGKPFASYVPSGWMGNTKALKSDDNCTENPKEGASCIKITYSAEDNWAGIAWQHPANDWGQKDGGFDLSEAKKFSFWARGEKGGEVVEFKIGGTQENVAFPDSCTGLIGKVPLTKEWKQYNLSLVGLDLSRVKTGFVWALAGSGSSVTFYLDDLRYE